MNYSEQHSHRWAWVFKTAYDKLDISLKTKDSTIRSKMMNQVVYGDLEKENPEKILPGVFMWIPYYRGVQGEMMIRYKCIKNAYKGFIDEDLIHENAVLMHKLFLDDVKKLSKVGGFLDFNQVLELSKDGQVESFRMPEDWVERYQDIRDRTLLALENLSFSKELLQEWMLFALRGVITYNFWLAKQAYLSFQIIDTIGEESFQKLIDESKDDFGWIVSREFFFHTMQRAGVEGEELYKMGRFAMFCDQIMESMDREKGEGVIKARASILHNCELFQGIRTPALKEGRSDSIIGMIVCDYCENHGKKNAAIFTPPDQHPNYKRIESFGYGNTRCVFHSDFSEGDDEEMDRFMEAQEIVFGEEEYELWD